MNYAVASPAGRRGTSTTSTTAAFAFLVPAALLLILAFAVSGALGADSDCWQGDAPGTPGDGCWSIDIEQCVYNGTIGDSQCCDNGNWQPKDYFLCRDDPDSDYGSSSDDGAEDYPAEEYATAEEYAYGSSDYGSGGGGGSTTIAPSLTISPTIVNEDSGDGGGDDKVKPPSFTDNELNDMEDEARWLVEELKKSPANRHPSIQGVSDEDVMNKLMALNRDLESNGRNSVQFNLFGNSGNSNDKSDSGDDEEDTNKGSDENQDPSDSGDDEEDTDKGSDENKDTPDSGDDEEDTNKGSDENKDPSDSGDDEETDKGSDDNEKSSKDYKNPLDSALPDLDEPLDSTLPDLDEPLDSSLTDLDGFSLTELNQERGSDSKQSDKTDEDKRVGDKGTGSACCQFAAK